MSLKKTTNCIILLAAAAAVGLLVRWQQVSGGADIHVYTPVFRTNMTPALGADRCVDCHADVCRDFEVVAHDKTLVPGSDPEMQQHFAGRSFQPAADRPRVEFFRDGDQLRMRSDEYPESIPIDWFFGSGHHAITPVSLLNNPQGQTELIECSVSWYPPDQLGLTPGAAELSQSGIAVLGNHVDHSTTMNCFGCHSTQLAENLTGEIHAGSIVRGVSCERCHPDSRQHLESVTSGGESLMERWSELTPLESVNRCGECHRRADQLTDQELSSERTVLVRFASVGLAMSRCFQNQPQQGESPLRLDCMTCHNPHQPAVQSEEFYQQKCLQCHGESGQPSRSCSFSGTSEKCLSCHMPPVDATEKLPLTDHWIRIRRPGDPPVSEHKPGNLPR
ncbi:MAG: multiheme c-type cytochrome [Planctomycetaceae bacterium]